MQMCVFPAVSPECRRQAVSEGAECGERHGKVCCCQMSPCGANARRQTVAILMGAPTLRQTANEFIMTHQKPH